MRRTILTIICAVTSLGVIGLARGQQPATSVLASPGSAARPAPQVVVQQVPTTRKVVALTFDDGPDPKYTPAVLAFARTQGVKVTFFLVGRQVQQYPDLVRAEAADGHALGNHTWDHHTMTQLSARQSRSEIGRCDDAITRLVGKQPHLLRPPKGLWDQDTYRAARALGYPIVLWSIELEHHPGRTPQQLAQRALNLVRPGAIILAHDGEASFTTDHSKTLLALPLLVDGLRKKGYEFVTIPELLALRAGRHASQVAVGPPL